MAFELEDFRQVSAGDAVANDGSVKRFWAYRTLDSFTTVATTIGYFNGASRFLGVGEIITVATGTDGTGIRNYVVNSITSGVVDIFEGPRITGDGTVRFLPDKTTPGLQLVLALGYGAGGSQQFNFLADYRISDVYLVQLTVPTGVATMSVEINSTTLASFDLAPVANTLRVAPNNNEVDWLLGRDVGPSDTYECVTTSAANQGTGYVYLLLVKR